MFYPFGETVGPAGSCPRWWGRGPVIGLPLRPPRVWRRRVDWRPPGRFLGGIGLQVSTRTQGTTPMTDDKIALSTLLDKSSDASFLREMIGFAADRLIALETEAKASFRSHPPAASSCARCSIPCGGG